MSNRRDRESPSSLERDRGSRMGRWTTLRIAIHPIHPIHSIPFNPLSFPLSLHSFSLPIETGRRYSPGRFGSSVHVDSGEGVRILNDAYMRLIPIRRFDFTFRGRVGHIR